MNQNDLEQWAYAAQQSLQEFCDDAQIADGDPDGEGELLDIRVLMAEFENIAHNRPLWQSQVAAAVTDESYQQFTDNFFPRKSK